MAETIPKMKPYHYLLLFFALSLLVIYLYSTISILNGSYGIIEGSINNGESNMESFSMIGNAFLFVIPFLLIGYMIRKITQNIDVGWDEFSF